MSNPGERNTSQEGSGGDTRIEPGMSEQLPLFSGGPGAWLRKVREEKNISLETAAEALNLGPGKVRALELDDYEKLPESIYIQGYLRNYARFLGEPVEPVLNAFLAVNPPPEVEPVLQAGLPIKPEISSNHRLVRLTSVAIALLLLVLLFVWWGDYLQRAWWKNGQQQVEVSPVGEADPAVTEPVSEMTGMDTQPLYLPPVQDDATYSATPFPDEQSASLQPDGPSLDQGLAETPSLVDEAPPPEDESAKIIFEFTASCWTEVRDARGKVQLIGEFRAGDRRILEGEAPFKVVLGNTPAVELTVNGQPVDLAQHSRGNVARFVLDPSEP